MTTEKTQAEKNAEFEALPLWQKRVAIAKDALAQLNSGHIEAAFTVTSPTVLTARHLENLIKMHRFVTFWHKIVAVRSVELVGCLSGLLPSQTN